MICGDQTKWPFSEDVFIVQEKDGLVLLRTDDDDNDGETITIPIKLQLNRDNVEFYREELICQEPNNIDSTLLSKERTVVIHRGGGGLGISVKGGLEHNLPVLISRIFKGQAADRSRALYVGDAILSVNGANVSKLRHDEAVQSLKHAGNDVTLIVKYFRPASLFLDKQNVAEENNSVGGGNGFGATVGGGSVGETGDHNSSTLAPIKKEWKLVKSIPLLFANISTIDDCQTDQACSSFQLASSNDSVRSGLIMAENSDWFDDIYNNILAVNGEFIKESGKRQISFMGWVKEKITNVAWAPTFLCLRGIEVYLFEQPPLTDDDWQIPERNFKIYESVFRILKQSDCKDGRNFCCLIENASCIATNQTVQKCLISVDSRQQLLHLEKAWHCANAKAITTMQNITYGCSTNDRICGLTFDLDSGICLFDNETKTYQWGYQFSQLKSSRDNSKSSLVLNFTNADGLIESRKIDSSKMYAIVYCLHSFLSAKLAFKDPIFLQNAGL